MMDTKKLRQKILDLAIHGKLVPQDPNDEPAGVLLQHIREEKERLIKEGKIKRSKTAAEDSFPTQELPQGWVCCRFDEICSKFSTGPFGSMVHKSDYVSQGGVPVVNPMNIVDGEIVTNNLMMVSKEKTLELNRYRLSKDDILIARRGDLSKCAIVAEDAVDWLCGTGSFFLHVPFVDPNYIKSFYLSEYVQAILARECVGATMDNLNQGVLGAIPFLLPPLAEQQRIANEIERWFAAIDELESNEADLQKTIDKAKSKILDLAIQGKLVPQDPNDEPASVLLERIREEKERLIKEGKIKRSKMATANNDIEPPFEIPESWGWCNITEVTTKITDGTHNSPPNKEVGAYKYITAKNIKPFGIDLGEITYVDKTIHDEIYARCNPEYGDILYIKDGATTGVVTINNLQEPFSLLSSVALIKPHQAISNKYLLYYLQSSYCFNSVRESMKGVGITRITLKQIEQWDIPIPPLAEQQRIVARLEELFAVLDSISAS